MIDYRALINSTLSEYIESIKHPKLKEAIAYALMPGGKRLRPSLTLAVLCDLGIDPSEGRYVAAGIEMIHTYSLIHDDLPAMDNDDWRRGKPSLHKKFGEALAILAADALLTDAFAFFTQGQIKPEIKNALVSLASKSAGGNGMVQGQVLDIESTHLPLDIHQVRDIQLRKTRDLINLSVIAGALIAKLDSAQITKLEEFSDNFGLAFQIKDDLDDLKEKTNLEINTYPYLLGEDQAKTLLKTYQEKSLSIISEIFGEKELYQLVARTL